MRVRIAKSRQGMPTVCSCLLCTRKSAILASLNGRVNTPATGDPELDATALEVRRLRRQADDLAAAAAARTSQVAAQLVGRGLSVRDVATLLGISPQRVSQLTAKAG